MTTIYDKAIQSVREGAGFTVDFNTRSLKINRRYIIKNGEYEGNLGGESSDVLSDIEHLYDRYRNSIPSARNDNRTKRYFQALPEHKLSDDDMMFGTYREEAQLALELFILIQVINNNLKWDEFAKDKWFWQSPNHSSLIIIKNWFNF